MVDEKTVEKDLKEKATRKRQASSSSSSSSASSTDSSDSSSSDSSSSSGSGSSSSSDSSASATSSPKKAASGKDHQRGDEFFACSTFRRLAPSYGNTRTLRRRGDARGRSPARRSRSPRGAPRAERGQKATIASSRRSPTPERRRRGRSTPSPRRRASPSPRRRSPASPRRRASPVDKRRRNSPSPKRRSPSPKRRAGRSTSRDRARRDRSRSKDRKSSPPPRKATPPPRRLCVRNLSRNVTKEHLAEIFGVYGTLKSSDMPMDRQHPYIGRGYGYVEFESAEDADKALKHMDGGQIDGQEITCELTHQPRSSISNGGGRRGMSPVRYRGPPSPRRYRSPPRFGRGTGGNMAPLGPSRFSRSSRSPRRRRSRS